MIPSPILQALQQKPELGNYLNPYRAKRSWPPDFTKLTPKHQFRLERRYKRRVKLKWARPRWTKAVKIMQLGSVVGMENLPYGLVEEAKRLTETTGVTVYGVLFMDWQQEHPPFQGVCAS